MRARTTPRWLSVGLIIFLILTFLSGCGERQIDENRAPVLLPRLVINIDEQGTPGLFGVSLAAVERLTGQDVSAYRLPADLVQRLMAADIQHLEVVIARTGIFLYANGQPLPYAATDAETWRNLGQTVEQFQVSNAGAIRWTLQNLIPRAGLQLALKFPTPEGAAEIPLRQSSALNPVQIEAARSAVAERSLILYADIAVGADGVPALAGVGLDELEQTLQEAGVPVDLAGARFDPQSLDTLIAANVQHVQLETEPEGLYIYLNGRRMPRIAWDAERLQNALDLYKRLDSASPYLPLANFLLPNIQSADVELTVFLPKASDAEDAPLSSFIESQ